MKLRLIEKDAPGLPAHIAVVEGQTLKEGITALFNAFTRKGINLAVWNGAENLVPARHRATIAKSFAKGAAWDQRDYLAVDIFHASHQELAVNDRAAFSAWQKSSHQLGLYLLKKRENTEHVKHGIAKTVRKEECILHYDTPSLYDVRLLRTVFGDATIYADDKNVIYRPGFHPRLRDDTKHVWTVRPWAISMLYAETEKKSIAHSEPWTGLGDNPDPRRVVEMIDADYKKPLYPKPGWRDLYI